MKKVHSVRFNTNRKCLYCKEFFLPDPRNVRHQKACSKPGCKRARRKDSQRRWLSRPENRNHFRDSDNVERVKEWRKLHPGYWRRCVRSEPQSTLQDVLTSQPAEAEEVKDDSVERTLQDVLSPQHPMVVGLISNLMDIALQDDIARTTRKLIERGRNILGLSSGKSEQQAHRNHDSKKTHIPRTASPSAGSLELGRSPPGQG